MRGKLIYNITISFSLFVVVTMFLILTLTYPEIKETFDYGNKEKIKVRTEVLEKSLSWEVDKLESELKYLVKDIVSDEELDKYLLQEYRGRQRFIKGIYLISPNGKINVKSVLNDQFDNYIESSIGDVVFYNQLIWSNVDTEDYVIYLKMAEKQHELMAVVINMSEFFQVNMNQSSYGLEVLDSYGQAILSTTNIDKDSYEIMFNGLLDNSDTLHVGDRYFSFQKLDTENVDLYLLLTELDQVYRWQVRGYLIKIGIVFVLVLSLGFIIAWRLYSKINRLQMASSLSQGRRVETFSKLDGELKKAINWVEEIEAHYGDLNELKEELIELTGKLPKEGDFIVEKKIKKSKKRQ